MKAHPKPALLLIAESSLEANLIKSLLEAQGVPVMLRQEAAGAALGLNVGPMGEVEVYVPEDRLQTSREIVEAYQTGANETANTESDVPDE